MSLAIDGSGGSGRSYLSVTLIWPWAASAPITTRLLSGRKPSRWGTTGSSEAGDPTGIWFGQACLARGNLTRRSVLFHNHSVCGIRPATRDNVLATVESTLVMHSGKVSLDKSVARRWACSDADKRLESYAEERVGGIAHECGIGGGWAISS